MLYIYIYACILDIYILTPPFTPLPSTTKDLRKNRLHVAFTLSLIFSLKTFFEQIKL